MIIEVEMKVVCLWISSGWFHSRSVGGSVSSPSQSASFCFNSTNQLHFKVRVSVCLCVLPWREHTVCPPSPDSSVLRSCSVSPWTSHWKTQWEQLVLSECSQTWFWMLTGRLTRERQVSGAQCQIFSVFMSWRFSVISWYLITRHTQTLLATTSAARRAQTDSKVEELLWLLS